MLDASPGVEYLIVPGFALASAMSSVIELAGSEGCVAIMNGTLTAEVIGAKSLTAYGSFGLTCGLIDMVVAVVSSSV